MMCATCGVGITLERIADQSAYLSVSVAAVERAQAVTTAAENDLLSRTGGLAGVVTLSGDDVPVGRLARWRGYHRECDPDPDEAAYRIPTTHTLRDVLTSGVAQFTDLGIVAMQEGWL